MTGKEERHMLNSILEWLWERIQIERVKYIDSNDQMVKLTSWDHMIYKLDEVKKEIKDYFDNQYNVNKKSTIEANTN